MRTLTKSIVAGAVLLASTAIAAPANAALVFLGYFAGTDCSGQGGFPNCYATQNGVIQGPTTDPLASPAIYKINNGGNPEINSTLFPSINGGEFTFGVVNNQLSFSYNAGAGDPEIHYFAIKQGSEYGLWYDSNAITSGNINLATTFPNNVGWSHITWFDTRTPAVPEPGTWAMMLIGFAGAGFALRRRRNEKLLQLA